MPKILRPVEKIVIDGTELQPYDADGTRLAAAVNGIAGETFDAVYAKLRSDEALAVDAMLAALRKRYGRLGMQGAKELMLALGVYCFGNEV